jgi:hypothetical protein
VTEPEGVLAIVLQVFEDGSGLVRISEGPEEGKDVPLSAAQLGPVEPGEAGRLVNRRRRKGDLARFVKRGR